MIQNQRTIQKSITFEGIGLHTGEKVSMTLLPAVEHSGISFVREDCNNTIIRADLNAVLNPLEYPRRTSIRSGSVEIYTVEHLLAALAMLGIDNLQVNIRGREVPGLDGSSLEYITSIEKAGIQEQSALKNYFVVREPLWIEDGHSSLIALPCPEFKVSYTLQYNNSFLGSEFLEVVLNGAQNPKDLAGARTFCLEDEIESLKKLGLGKGANYENTLVISKNGVVKNTLRYKDECVRHKILDLIGDLYLAGPMKAHIIALRSGHNHNIKLLAKLKSYRDRLGTAGVVSSKDYVPSASCTLEAEQIMKVLPHRYPFLLVDRIIQLEHGKRAVGIKNVTINDYFFQGHFPSKPVMPGVLLVEAMAQVGGVLMLSSEEHCGKIAYFLAADEVKFRKTVIPGDQLCIEVDAERVKSKTGQVKGVIKVDGKVVAEGVLRFILGESQ